jgi:hypothetical protein
MDLKNLVGKIWNIAKWKGTRFWYDYAKVRILLFQTNMATQSIKVNSNYIISLFDGYFQLITKILVPYI